MRLNIKRINFNNGCLGVFRGGDFDDTMQIKELIKTVIRGTDN